MSAKTASGRAKTPAVKMKVKKGDLVQMLAGKDRGKQGRVLDARPREGKVLVENLNVARRHQKPQPLRDTSRMGGPQMIPGGIHDRPMAVPVSNVMVVCPVCKLPTRVGHRTAEIAGRTVRIRVCKREGCGQDIDN
jgi:large subunit ribosomal protein L24